ncbi:hypothetical protein H9Q74_003027 [Fusarium xylarioides]|nr:hypothetical protein H9Q71_001490 [Fusarium xylarioides]KAG5826901.1 hypothetical protein H9Q74_003027 [Fusarium xylarioides]
MLDWNDDLFMSDWDAKYVSTNVKPQARKYDRGLFLELNSKLASSHPELKSFSHAIIAAVCCAVSRADVVGRFFDDITFDSTTKASEKLFLSTREAITIIFPYVGMPTCIPACYGMIGVVERKGAAYASSRVLRKTTIDEEDVKKGTELKSRIYSGVGNSGIFSLMDKYFTDLCMSNPVYTLLCYFTDFTSSVTCSTVVTWGYLISKANEEVFQPNESHLIIAASIAGLGATRQTKSHIKATLGIGNSVECVKAVLDVVKKIAEWADRPIGDFDVDALSLEIQNALRN